MAKRSGWERMVYRDTAGSAAATLITPNVVDVGMSNVPERWEATSRGDGTAVPKKVERIACLVKTPGPISMIYDENDTHMAALLTAADAGTAIAIKIIRRTGGATEFDGDVTLEYDAPGGLKEGQTVTFTLAPTDEAGRAWT
jgi:hypothetical protein